MIALIGLIVGAIYFGYKAFSLKENWEIYAVIGGIATGVFSFITATVVLFGMMFLGIEIRGGGVDILGIPILAASIYLVDKWSGLYWNSEQHAAEKEKKNENLSDDELATIRNIQIQKGEGSLEELQAYEATRQTEDSEDSDVEKLELTQNSLPGEIDYIVVPDTISKSLPKNEEGLIKCIAEYKKYTEEEWTENIPMYAAIELDKTGFEYTPEIKKQLDEYAKSLKFENFVEFISTYIPK